MFTKVLAVEFIEKQRQKQQQRSDTNETNVQRKSTTSKLGDRERRVEEYGGKITRKIEDDDDEERRQHDIIVIHPGRTRGLERPGNPCKATTP